MNLKDTEIAMFQRKMGATSGLPTTQCMAGSSQDTPAEQQQKYEQNCWTD